MNHLLIIRHSSAGSLTKRSRVQRIGKPWILLSEFPGVELLNLDRDVLASSPVR